MSAINTKCNIASIRGCCNKFSIVRNYHRKRGGFIVTEFILIFNIRLFVITVRID